MWGKGNWTLSYFLEALPRFSLSLQLAAGMMPLRRQGSRRRGPRRGLPQGGKCMEAIIPLTQGLFNLGADLLKRRRYSEGVRILRRLLETPDLSPTIAARLIWAKS